MTCLLGRICGLCFTRREYKPLPACKWRTLLGPVAQYESNPNPMRWVEQRHTVREEFRGRGRK